MKALSTDFDEVIGCIEANDMDRFKEIVYENPKITLIEKGEDKYVLFQLAVMMDNEEAVEILYEMSNDFMSLKDTKIPSFFFFQI
jgi:hypothetical protein